MQNDQNQNNTTNDTSSYADPGVNPTASSYQPTSTTSQIDKNSNPTINSDNANNPYNDSSLSNPPLSTDTNTDTDQGGFIQNEGQEMITAPHAPQKYGGKKIIATIFGILVLIGGVTAGVVLVQQRQNLEQQAASGSACDQSPDCVLVDNAPNSGSRTVDREITYVDITDKEYHRYNPGNNDDGCRRVNISGNTISWERYGDGPECKDVSNVQIWMSQGPTPTNAGQPEFVKICHYTADQSAHPWQAIEVSKQGWESGHDEAHDFKKTEFDFFYTNTDPNCPWPDPGNQGITCADIWCEGGSPNPTSPQNFASCSEVKAYDTSWNLLSQTQLANLNSGTIVRFTVSGSASSGTFDKARFSVNSVSLGETTLKKPSSGEFYIEYTIPEGTTSFNVDAQIHHTELGWF